MDAAERDREFVAGLAAECPRLQVAQVMWVGRLAAADQAGLLGDVAQVLAVAVAAGRRNRERALVDAAWLGGMGSRRRMDDVQIGAGPSTWRSNTLNGRDSVVRVR